jgi:5-methyltetrahydrofolate--homocysteine methyltransferase
VEENMDLTRISEAVIAGDAAEVEAGVRAALADGVTPEALLDTALIPAMTEVGRLFETGQAFVPEMLIAARAMQRALNILRPLLADNGVAPVGVVALGTVAGDLHDIGKNLVGLMLEGAGYEVRDLGTDVKPEQFIQAVKDGAQILGMSALLTTTMPSIKMTLDALEEAGVRQSVRVIVGGAPLRSEYADEVGADGFAPDAAGAVRTVNRLMGRAEEEATKSESR